MPVVLIGRAHLKEALAEFEHGDAVEVTWRSFELDPGAPAMATVPLAEQLRRKYGGTPADIEAMFAGVTARAAAVGLDFRFDTAQSGNTVDAHRLLHLARATGQQDQLKELILHGLLHGGRGDRRPRHPRTAGEAGGAGSRGGGRRARH